jgi:hypothetical protein
VLKTLLIIVLVIGALVGGLLTLRRSARLGMPDAQTLDRARERERELEAAEKKDAEK